MIAYEQTNVSEIDYARLYLNESNLNIINDNVFNYSIPNDDFEHCKYNY